MWIWASKNGALLDQDLTVLERGYAGHGSGRNNPDQQHIVNVGPLPEGLYTILVPRDTPKHGPYAMPLVPDQGNEMWGRSGFLIHGDNAITHDASRGCIVLSRQRRETIWESGDRRLRVIAI